MHVVGESGFDANLLIGPDQGAMRLFLLGGVVPAGFATNAHHHHGEEIFRVLSGRLRFTVSDQTTEVHGGHVVIVPPGTSHSHHALEDAEVEVLGETGAGIFIWEEQPDGPCVETELFIPGIPWSRQPPDGTGSLEQDGRRRLYRSAETPPTPDGQDPQPAL
jgi:cupin domain